MTRKSGYFICYRNIWQHPVFKNLLQASAWIYMISSASHQDKELRFLDNKIFVRRGELIFPLRVNAKRFKMSYSEMRTFILRLVRRKMITTRTNQLQPTTNHPSRKVTLIKVINYDKFQYGDNSKPPYDHLSQQGLKTISKKQILNSSNKNVNKSSNGIIYTGNQFGDYVEIEAEGKLKWKHKYKENMPLKDKL